MTTSIAVVSKEDNLIFPFTRLLIANIANEFIYYFLCFSGVIDR